MFCISLLTFVGVCMNNTIPADQVLAWVLLSNFEYGLPDGKTPLLGPFEKGIRNPKSIASLPFEELDAGALGQLCPVKRKKYVEICNYMNRCWNLCSLLVHAFARPIRGPRSSSPHLDLSAMGCGASAQPAAATTEQSPKDAWVLKWHVEWKGDLLTCTKILRILWKVLNMSFRSMFLLISMQFHMIFYLISKLLIGHVAWMPRTPSLQTPPLRPRTPRPQRPPPKRRRHKQKQPQSKQRKASCPGFRGMGPEISRGEFVIRLGINIY